MNARRLAEADFALLMAGAALAGAAGFWATDKDIPQYARESALRLVATWDAALLARRDATTAEPDPPFDWSSSPNAGSSQNGAH